MTVTFYADLIQTKLPRKLRRCIDIYPGLDNKDFAGDYLTVIDTEGFYCEYVIDVDYMIDVVFSNDKFDTILKCIDPNLHAMSRHEGQTYVIVCDGIPDFKRKVIKAINSPRTKSLVQNFRYPYPEILRSLHNILAVCDVAMRFNASVYWA